MRESCGLPGRVLAVLALTVLTVVACTPTREPKPPQAASVDSRAPVLGALAHLPLAFEPNTGQAPPEVRYVGRGMRYRLWLTGNEARFAAPTAAADPPTIRLRLVGAAPAPRIVAEDALPGQVNYFVGADAARWRRNVPTYRRVVYRDVYPHVDLVFHGDHRAAEFDFVVAPGADPRTIGLELDGAESVTLEDGDVVASTGDAALRLRKPVVYQDIDGRRQPVPGRFAVQGRRLAFEVGAYDRARPLVIDPVVTYSTYLGGTGSEAGRGIAVDPAGNMYAVVSGMGVVKLSADGSRVLYTTVLGDADLRAIAVDAAGHAHVAGNFAKPRSGVSGVYPVTANALQPTFGQPCSQGDSDGVMAKLSPDGSQLLYSSFVGGRCFYLASGIAVDRAGNMYVTGEGSTTTGYPATRPPFAPSGPSGPFPGWIQVVAADFSRYVYSTLILAGDGSQVRPTAIAVDGAGNAYLAGLAGPGLPTTAGAFQPGPVSDFGASFLAKISADGARLAYATYFGAPSTRVTAVAVDGAGNAYLAGHAGAGLPTVNALQPGLAGGTDAFVARLDAAGSALAFSTYLGGGADDAATGIGLDAAGNVHVAGPTDSIDFPQRNALPPQLGSAGSNFLAALTPSGRALLHSTYVGDGQTLVEGLAVTPSGSACLTGGTTSTSLPTVRPLQAAHGGGASDAFVMRIDPGAAGGTIRVFITAPAAGATVSGTVWPTVWIENAATGAKTYTLSEGATTASSTSTASNGPVSLPWPTAGGANGSRTITVSVRDAAGNTGSASRTFDVDNGGATLGAAFTSPAEGATVSGSVTIGMSALNAGGTPISFMLAIDGAQLFAASGTAATASFTWNTAGVAGGPHRLTLTVRDGAGRTATATRNVTVAGAGGGTIRVFVTAPGVGATVSGTTWLTVWIENAAAGAKTYTLGEGGTPVGGTTTSSNGPVSLAWPTAGGANGSRTVTVAVRDAAGNTGSASRAFNVQNGGGGSGTLRVFVTAPRDLDTARGTVWFTAWVEGAGAGSKTYTLGVGTASLDTTGTTSSGPVSLRWSTSAADNGSRLATVTVRDAAGNTGSTSVRLTVAN